jgi:phosphatidylserine decarboxylase
MGIHKEGKRIIILYLGFGFILFSGFFLAFPQSSILQIILAILLGIGLIGLLIFFRNPQRNISKSDNQLIYSPADGKIVAIEEVDDDEYFKGKRLQVSIFMSVTNVHVNRNPISGTVKYFKYHAGKYLVAWHPKSSTENERTTTVLSNGKQEILLRQIAGALARRIVNYVKVGDKVQQGSDMGFIKFGSRVDLLLPTDVELNIELNQRVKGNQTVIGKLKN